MTTIPCPFVHCNATVALQRHLLGYPPRTRTADIIASHGTEPGSWFGACPASLMEFPLTADGVAHLDSQAVSYRTMAEKFAPPVNPWARRKPNPAGEHPLQPRPDPEPPTAFRESTTTTVRSDMASVAEVKAAVSRAMGVLDEADALAANAVAKYAEAKREMLRIEAMSGQDLGARMIGTAEDDVSTAIHASGAGRAAADLYVGGL